MATESNIDQKYREIVFQKYFNNPVLKGSPQKPKWVSPCPFCSAGRKSDSKRNEKVSALLWNERQRSWVFSCRRTACPHPTLSFPKLIERLDGDLFLRYQQERFHAGSTGFQTNCPDLEVLGALRSSRPFPRGSGPCSGSSASSGTSSRFNGRESPLYQQHSEGEWSSEGPRSSAVLRS